MCLLSSMQHLVTTSQHHSTFHERLVLESTVTEEDDFGSTTGEDSWVTEQA